MTIDWANSIDWGDPPAWIAAALSLVAGAIALRALKHSRRSADASTTSAEAATEAASAAKVSAQAAVRQAAAAERQNELAEAALKLAEETAAASRTQLDTTSAREALAGPEPPYVAWWIEHKSKNTYVLRNLGTATARKVEIDDSRIPCGYRMDVLYGEIAPDASVEFRLLPAWGHPKPNELWVRWEGHEEWTAVPVP